MGRSNYNFPEGLERSRRLIADTVPCCYFVKILFKRDRACVSKRRGRECRGREERESPADSVLSVEPDVGLHLTIRRSQPELKPGLGHATE